MLVLKHVNAPIKFEKMDDVIGSWGIVHKLWAMGLRRRFRLM